MSVLLRRSILVLGLLFGLLFAVGTAVLWHFHQPLWLALLFAVLTVGLQYLLGPSIISWVFRINWHSPNELNPEFAKFLSDACAAEKIPVPKFGIIEDGNPNAFTFGHTPKDARVVVTRGLIDMLSEQELEAVVGHELGHIKHWDFVVMTIASLVPLMLYIIYVWTRNERKSNAWVIAAGSYIAYILSQYIVLFLSRIREYYADQYSAEMTKNPKALSSALVTIAYGLAKAKETDPEPKDKKKRKTDLSPAMASMGFFSSKGASHFAMAASDPSGNFSSENMIRAMRWDICNPWAKWFELNSTHPLPAKRIAELGGYADNIGPTQKPDANTQVMTDYRSLFLQDMAIALLPYIGVGIGCAIHAGGNSGIVGAVAYSLIFGGLGYAIRILFSYKSDFKPAEIVSLVGETEVSHIRPIPAEIKGQVIGRGLPGAFWSSDLVLQDQNGFVTLVYRQPLQFLAFLFGVFKAKDIVGKQATVRGWYRRGPGPYFEMKDAVLDDGQTIKCYYFAFQLVLAAISMAIGALIAMNS